MLKTLLVSSSLSLALLAMPVLSVGTAGTAQAGSFAVSGLGLEVGIGDDDSGLEVSLGDDEGDEDEDDDE